jgi:hypothetical protein
MIARICEVANSDQICVYTRANSTSAETLLTEGLDYTFTANETITLVGNPNLGQIIIRRCTLNSKMLTTFTEGSKLSAKQLNIALHQLLFIAQEKEFIGSVNNHFYPLSTSIAAWNSGTNYVIGNYALQNGVVYQAIANNTNSQPPSANWTAVNFVTNGFIIQGGATLSGPVLFDLNGVTNGKTLIWQGSKFAAGLPSLNLDNIADVVITSPQTNSVLRFDGINWINVPTYFDISSSTTITLPGHVFAHKDNASNSYTANAGNFPVLTIDELNEINSTFGDNLKDANLNWNVPSVLTVMKMLNVLVPNYNPTKTFKEYMSFIKSNIDTFSANIGNPVKIKLHWNLSRRRIDLVQTGTLVADTEENISGYKTAFWDDPKELYNTNMYTDIRANVNKYALDNAGTVYLHGAYFHQETPTNQSAIFRPKIWGYGIKRNGFYLNVPECYTSSLCNIPIFKTGSGGEAITGTTPEAFYFERSDLNFNQILMPANANNSLRNNKNLIPWRDTYLYALRDMCFAPHRGVPRNNSNVLVELRKTLDNTTNVFYNALVDQYSRYMKSWLIWADYNGWEDVNYKRLEFDGGVTGGVPMPNEFAKPCLFKIPKNIIYYNKHALVQSREGNDLFSYGNADFSTTDPVTGKPGNSDNYGTLSSLVRFQGTGTIHYKERRNINDTISPSSAVNTGIGYLYKANSFWQAWCTSWSQTVTDANDATYGRYFNESDIEWIASNLIYPTSNSHMASDMQLHSLGAGIVVSGINNDGYSRGSNFFPWPYRPNLFNRVFTNIQEVIPSTNVFGNDQVANTSIGTHFFNLDYNTIFSTASNFVPDPVDEYVFRIVAKDSLINLFSPTGDGLKPIPSTIIVEHGFSEDITAGLDFGKSLFNEIYRKNNVYIESKDVWTRLDKSKVQVFVQNEQIENYTANGVTQKQYVINLCIRVPRLKSIGYARIYRQPSSAGMNVNPALTSYAWFNIANGSTAGADPDAKNRGPWTIGPLDEEIGLFSSLTYSVPGPGEYSPIVSTVFDTSNGFLASSSDPSISSHRYYRAQLIAGRNECAVKFTRLGIPGNLWIKLSVLNTDGSLSLLTSDGAWNPQA